MMLIIAVTGLRCAGKSLVNDVAKEYDIPVYEESDYVIELLENLYPDGNMDLRSFTTKCHKEKGKDVFAKLVYERAIKEHPNANVLLFTGLRTKNELQYFQKHADEVLSIAIVAEEELRFERLKQRNRPRDPKTFEEFKRVEQIENSWGLSELIEMVDYKIENNSTPEDVKFKIRDLFNNILN